MRQVMYIPEIRDIYHVGVILLTLIYINRKLILLYFYYSYTVI